jgi:hypothetical protein
MTIRQALAIAILAATVGAVLEVSNTGPRVIAAAAVVAAMVWTFYEVGYRPPCATIGLLGCAVVAVVSVTLASRLWQRSHIPSEVYQRRQQVHQIELDLQKSDVCPLVIAIQNPDSSSAFHRLWMRYGSIARELISEEVIDVSGRSRFFVAGQSVIAVEVAEAEGAFSQFYYRGDGRLMAVDHLDDKRSPKELEYFGDSDRAEIRLSEQTIWPRWMWDDEQFKDAPATHPCNAELRPDTRPSLTPSIGPPIPPTGYH